VSAGLVAALSPRVRAIGRGLFARYPALRPLALRAISLSSLVRIRRQAGQQVFDAARPTILLCVHEASRTGAPILGLNLARELSRKVNVVCVLLNGGEIREDFAKFAVALVSPAFGSIIDADPAAFAQRVLRPLQRDFPIGAILANSTETAVVAAAGKQAGIPVLCLVHEFAGYMSPPRLATVIDHADLLVFSSEVQRHSFRDAGEMPPSIVLPQGKSEIPERAGSDPTRDADAIEPVIAAHARGGQFLCIGCGYVQPRKGVDLFIAAAARLRRQGVEAHFVWVGDGYMPDRDFLLSVWLKDQVERSGLADRFTFLPALGKQSLERLYATADAMFLSSRLDPLPNVAIDAVAAGLPVVCFDQASGLPEILASDPDLRSLVVPYFGIEEAAAVLSRLAVDPSWRSDLRAKLLILARERFGMSLYADTLETLLASLAAGKRKEEI
jgi:hypothetical protein